MADMQWCVVIEVLHSEQCVGWYSTMMGSARAAPVVLDVDVV
jgi:hypothetical protein